MTSYQHLAVKRIEILFDQARLAFHDHPERSHRYVTLARRIAMKTKVKIPSLFKRRYCHRCYQYLVPGINSRVRTRDHRLVLFCFSCKTTSRIPLEAKAKKPSSFSR